jgi:septum formation protein
MEKIILASASPRRHQLLTWAEIDFDVIVQETDESYPSHLKVDLVPEFIARNKAMAVKSMLKTNQIILAADTVVVIDQQIIGKPADRAAAIQTLQKLSGRQHRVITGVVVMQAEKYVSISDTTLVTFNELTQHEIEYYVDQYRPYDKAGAYAIQEWIGVIGIASIEGDFYNVMGLPVSRVVQLLRSFTDKSISLQG